MRRTNLLLLVIATTAFASCKRETAQPAAAERHAVVADAVPAPVESSTQPATHPFDGTITEPQIVQFIAASRKVMSAAKASGILVETTPGGFADLIKHMRPDDPITGSLAGGDLSIDDWQAIGTRAWAAWSIAQGDYNTEAPLRENQKQLALARERLVTAEAVLKGGVRVMTPEQRAVVVAADHDAAVNAADRAEMWAQRAAQLREQITDAGGDADAARPGQPAGGDARGDTRGLRTALSQELAAAQRNERQAREDARRAEESAEHPEQATNDTEKSDLLRTARTEIEPAKARIAQCQQRATELEARLAEDRKIDKSRSKVPASDVELMRAHLVEFNNAWGMTVEGRIANP